MSKKIELLSQLKNDLDKIFIDYFKNNKLINKLNNSSILITGANGFFGKWIIAFLDYLIIEHNFRIKIYLLVRDKNTFKKKYVIESISNFRFIESDLEDFKLKRKLKIDYLIHAGSFGNNNKLTFSTWVTRHILSTINGTNNLISYLNVNKSIVYLSSGAVYQNFYSQKNFLKKYEKFYFLEKIIYGASKIIAEFLLLNNKSSKVAILRCFTFLGPFIPLDKNYAVGNFISSVINNKPIRINSNGLSYRSYMYMTDAIGWIFTILLKSNKSGIYNVGSDSLVSVNSLAYKIKKISRLNIKILRKKNCSFVTKLIYFLLFRNTYIPNISKTKKEFSLSLNVDLDDGLTKTYDWFKLNKNIIND